MNERSEGVPIFWGKLATYFGALWSFFSGLSVSEVGVVVGIFVGVLGLIFSQFWSWRRDRREAREMQARMHHKYGTGWDEL